MKEYDYEKLWKQLMDDVERWCNVGGWDKPEGEKTPEIMREVMKRREEQQ